MKCKKNKVNKYISILATISNLIISSVQLVKLLNMDFMNFTISLILALHKTSALRELEDKGIQPQACM